MNAVKVGSNFVTVNPVAMTKLVDPASNTKGLIIQTATATSSTGTLNLWAAQSTPSGIGDVSKPIIWGCNGSSTGGANAQYYMPNPIFVPAGYGLYAMASTTGAYLSMTWDLVV